MLNSVRNYIARHMQAGLNSLGQLSRTPIASLMTCLIIGITLALPTALFLVLKNAENIRDSFRQTTQFTLYLKKNTSEDQAQTLTHNLQKNSVIETAYAISPQQGLKELQQQAGYQDVIEELRDNPLPWSIVVVPRAVAEDAETLDKLNQTLKQLPDVDTVQMDMLWIKRLGTLIVLAQRMVIALAVFLCIAMLLIVNNSIRNATQNSHKEIEIIQLIGGTDAFIRRPFLYAGIVYGLIGGIIAWQLVDILLYVISEPVHNLATLYNSSFSLVSLGLKDTAALLGGSMFIGLLGSWLAVTRHLRA